MIVPEVVVLLLDSLLLHSASSRNPEVHLPHPTLYSLHAHRRNRYIKDGMPVTMTMINCLDRSHPSQVWGQVERRSKSGNEQLWIKSANLEVVNPGIRNGRMGMEVEVEMVYHSVIDNS